MALAPGTRLGPYQVVAELGAGGMGVVYRAVDTNLKRPVALKVLPDTLASDAERLARFQREAEVLGSLSHPNIAIVHGLEKGVAITALVMELVEGPTLADRVVEGPIPVDEALAIARQIAEALEAAHEQGIVHRDLKPANIKLRPDGTVKVLDFGLAKAMDPAGAARPGSSVAPTITTPAMTQAGLILGTAAYMSPEQARGKPVDRRTDIWAFGCVLYEMLTGRRAFGADDVSLTMARVLEREVDLDALPGDVSPRMRELLALCLRKDPRQRAHDAGDVRLVLEGAFEVAGAPRGAAGVTAIPSPLWRRLLPLAATAVVAGVLVGLAVHMTRPAEQRPVIRSAHVLPDGRNFRNTVDTVLAVSPDGRRFVYNGTGGLYLREMDTLEERLIPGTDGAIAGPFFSPDGQSLAFFRAAQAEAGQTGGELVRMAISGGASVKLATVTGAFGGSWGADGTILYAQSDGIWRVSENGGDPQRIIATAEGEQAHGPRHLPAGDWVLFTLTRGQGPSRWDQAEIVAESPVSGERRILHTGGSDARFASSGHLLYAFEDVLYAVPFDVDRLEATGGAVPVVDGVRRVGNPVVQSGAAFYGFTDNGLLVYAPGTNSQQAERSLVWVDHDGREQPIGVPPRAYITPRVSPDGTRIAASVDGDLWVAELARPGTLRRVTRGPAAELYPLWSPDGERLLFGSEGTGSRALYSTRADGRGEAEPVLTDGPENAGLLSPEGWSADGQELVFIYTHPGITGFNFGRLPMDGRQAWEPLLETPFDEDTIAISPDGRWIAYESNASGRYEVYVERFPEMGGIQTISAEGGRHPVWSADGRELFYRRGDGVDGTMMVSAIRTEPAFSIGGATELFSGDYYYPPAGPRQYDVGPDGRFVMIREAAAGQPGPRQQVVVVQNWFTELERLAPTD